MSKHRRLPGTHDTTDSVDTYLNAWHAEVQPLLDATGWELHSFDPGFMLSRDGSSREVFSLSTAAVRDLVAALRK